MLVLTRRTDEIVKIGDDIEVKIVDIRGNRVRLGIAAPSGTKIMRTELLPGTTNTIPAVHRNDEEY